MPTDGIKAGSTVKDSLPKIDNKYYHYFTASQLKNMVISGVDKETLKFEGANSISDSWISNLDKADADTKFYSFQLKFDKDVKQTDAKEITISYSTIADVSDLPALSSRVFSNGATVTINGQNYTKSNSYTYQKEGEKGNLVKKTNWGSEDGSYLYDSNGTRLYYKVVLNGNYSAKGEITYTDTFPENTSLVTTEWNYDGKRYNPNDTNISYGGILFEYETNTAPGNIGSYASGNYKCAKDNGITVSNSSDGFTVTIPETAYKFDGPKYSRIILYYALDYKVPEGTTPSFPIKVENKGSATSDGQSDVSGTVSTIETKTVEKLLVSIINKNAHYHIR